MASGGRCEEPHPFWWLRREFRRRRSRASEGPECSVSTELPPCPTCLPGRRERRQGLERRCYSDRWSSACSRQKIRVHCCRATKRERLRPLYQEACEHPTNRSSGSKGRSCRPSPSQKM